VQTALEAFVAAEGQPELVMFSGGEPTIHPHIVEFLATAKDKGVQNVVLNTNGLRLAHDRPFVEKLARLGVRIYLQFDGLSEATHLAIRGRDLRQARQTALDRCADAGLSVILVAAVESGINEAELGESSASGSPIRRCGAWCSSRSPTRAAHPVFDPLTRITNADVIHALVAQCAEWFEP
jgi:uncharacterized radical SAM superfamily Fe-S cluster-containing enzyme